MADIFDKNYAAAIAVDCPTCKAVKGKNCFDRRSGKPNPRRAYHSSRLALAQGN